ncbi:DUF2490 domain-containing protein [Marinilabilia sp.]
MKIPPLLLLLFILFPFEALAQSQNEIGFLPSINFNKKLPRDWAVNFKVESRQSLYKEGLKYDYLLTDFALAGDKKIGINTKIAAGYLLSKFNGGIKNRFFQQLSMVKRYPTFKMAHRFSTDQTFEKDEDPEFRLRYRASAEVPLSGASLDPREFYFKINNEYLNALQARDYDLEIRVAGFIGFVITPSNKLEIGIDNRIDSFVNGNSRNRMWLSLNLYQSI